MTPKRRPQTNRKQASASKCRSGRSNEDSVIIPDRAFRNDILDRERLTRNGASEGIRNIRTTVKTPVQKNRELAELAAAKPLAVYTDVSGDGTEMLDDDHILFDKTYGDSDYCPRCVAAIQ